MLTIWKPKTPAPPKDLMPDVHEAAAQAIQERNLRIEKQFNQMVEDVTCATRLAVRQGKLSANNYSVHRSFFSESVLAVEKWLQKKGYEVSRTSGYDRNCRCATHLRWSWAFKAGMYGKPPLILGIVEREPSR